MTIDVSRSDFTIGLIGAGVMGRGIAQVAAEAGFTVLLADAQASAVEAAAKACAEMIRRKAEKGQIDEAAAQAAIARLRKTGAGPEACWAEFASCDLVIEAVVERMDVKHAVVAGLEAVVRDECVIASNTSSLSVTGIAAKARLPGRVAGFHFFNPVPLMRVVEVVGGVMTAEWALDALTRVAKRFGHHPVRTTDTPGFLVNHAGRAFGTEAMRIVSEGIASFAEVDRVMTEAAGFRMGPFELLDLTGLDVSQVVIESIYRQYYDEPRYRPVYLGEQRRAAGLYGRKVGRGFYVYADGKQQRPPETPAPKVEAGAPSVWVSARHADAAERLREVLAAAGARIEAGDRPSADALIFLTPFGEDCTTAALAEGVDPARAVAVDCLMPLDRRRTLMRNPLTRADMQRAAHALLGADGAAVTVINDSPGFIAQRILACVVNVGSDIAQQRVAAPDDINRAVELGLGYPRGPLRWGDELGSARVLDILDNMRAFYGDMRYRPSPWLKRRAMLGVSLMQAD